MLIDVDGLKDKVKPQTKKTRKYLKLAEELISSINIPSDFSERTKLINIPKQIIDIDSKINGIETWVNDAIDNFLNVEVNNRGLMDNIIGSISLFSAGSKIVETAENRVSTLNPNQYIDEIKNTVENTVEGIFNIGRWMSDTANEVAQTATKIGEDIGSTVSWAWNTGTEIKEDVENCVSTKIEDSLEFVGSKVSSDWSFAYQNIITPSWNYLKQTGASVANGIIGVSKGIGQFGESLLDAGTMLLTGVGSIPTGLADGITYLYAVSQNETSNWNSITGSMWDGVMGFVADEHVNNAFEGFYEKNKVGQWLDENANSLFKSDGIITNIFSGVGYVAGIAALTILTLGIGGAATGGATAVSSRG